MDFTAIGDATSLLMSTRKAFGSLDRKRNEVR